MTKTNSGRPEFEGLIPAAYDKLLAHLIFETYASDLATRVPEALVSRPAATLLEIAAGTGVVTRALARHLPVGVAITATDLHAPMLDHAAPGGIGECGRGRVLHRNTTPKRNPAS